MREWDIRVLILAEFTCFAALLVFGFWLKSYLHRWRLRRIGPEIIKECAATIYAINHQVYHRTREIVWRLANENMGQLPWNDRWRILLQVNYEKKNDAEELKSLVYQGVVARLKKLKRDDIEVTVVLNHLPDEKGEQ